MCFKELRSEVQVNLNISLAFSFLYRLYWHCPALFFPSVVLFWLILLSFRFLYSFNWYIFNHFSYFILLLSVLSVDHCVSCSIFYKFIGIFLPCFLFSHIFLTLVILGSFFIFLLSIFSSMFSFRHWVFLPSPGFLYSSVFFSPNGIFKTRSMLLYVFYGQHWTYWCLCLELSLLFHTEGPIRPAFVYFLRGSDKTRVWSFLVLGGWQNTVKSGSN